MTFARFCSPCPTVGVGDRVGPDLAGITERRDRQWLKNFIMDPVKMRNDGDPLALAISEQYPGAVMPRLGVGDIDAEELLAYIEEETARLAAMEAKHQARHDHSSHKHRGEEQAGHDHETHHHDHASHGHDHSGGDHQH